MFYEKIFTVFIVFFTLISLVSCKHEEVYSLLNPTDEISNISIVSLSFDKNNKLIQKEIQKIDDVNSFLDDFRKIECYTYYGDPTGVTVEGVEAVVIKISYENGEYELINWNGQAEQTEDRGFRFYSGYSVFNEEQFETLITKYLSNTDFC